MTVKRNRIIFIVLIVTLLALIASGVLLFLRLRTSHYEGAAIATEFALIDRYIGEGDSENALKVLERVEKRAFSVPDQIGVYKRYMSLSDSVRAEKSLKRALLRSPANHDLIALYGNFLLRQDRVSEALKRVKILSGTEYGSIYAEAFLRNALQSGDDANTLFTEKKGLFSWLKKRDVPADPKKVFLDERFIPVYIDAFKGSGICRWIINAASIYMVKGAYDDAAVLYPGEAGSFHDALFWGLVFYDSARYAQSLEALLKADTYADADDIASAVELRALESDNYYILGDDKTAQEMRRRVVDASSPYMKSFMENKTPVLSDVLPLIFMNTALYARDSDNPIEQHDRLYDLVNFYPYYGPGLAAYAEYAIASQNRPKEGSLEQGLRQAGLRSLAMEEWDAVPVVSYDDVIVRIDNALTIQDSTFLIVLKEILKSKSVRSDEKSEKASRVWALLEAHELEPSLYPPEIMRYAVRTLVTNNNDHDAEILFNNYLQASYAEKSADGKTVFVFAAAEHPETLRLWECEDAAYFAVKNKDYASAEKLYRYILSTFTKRSPVLNTAGQNRAVTNSYVNMANILSGYSRDAEALDFLNKASGRVSEPRLKAEVLYRIAECAIGLGNRQDAVRSCQYALNLNPSHNKARFLLRQLL